jgi:hypothetical protein
VKFLELNKIKCSSQNIYLFSYILFISTQLLWVRSRISYWSITRTPTPPPTFRWKSECVEVRKASFLHWFINREVVRPKETHTNITNISKNTRTIIQSVSKRTYIKGLVELCGSIILLCRTMSSRWSRQIRCQKQM